MNDRDGQRARTIEARVLPLAGRTADRVGLLLLLLALTAGMLVAMPTEDPPMSLEGRWLVDLRPTPDAEPYLQPFVVTSVADNRLEGTFYGSAITSGRINADWGDVRFAFVTSDGSGTYHTSGVMRDGKLEGLTHAIGRDFLAVWTGSPDISEPTP